MKIAIDCRFIGKSGIGTYIENIVQCMISEHPENDYLLLSNKKFSITIPENVDVQIIKNKPFTIKEMFFMDCSKINNCDVYFSPYINIPFGIKIPIYSTIHDVIFLDVPELTSRFGRLLRWGFYKLALVRSKKVFTVSNFSKKQILYHFHTKTPIVVTYSAISNVVKMSKRDSSIKMNYFVFIGNIKAHKGIDILLKAFRCAQKQGLNSELYIVGEKEKFRTNDKKLLSELVNSKIHFTGFVSNEELITLLKSAKALILPSRYEGLGLPPMEAIYLGTNAIVSDIPVFKEIYKDLPVEMFVKDNVNDLTKCLLEQYPKEFDVVNTQKYIDSIYNFSIICNKILKEIKNDNTK